MSTSRLEAFSDAVIAILMTIMVLELKVPTDEHGATWAAIRPVLPIFGTYALSFVFLAIYWNNHHHLLAATERVNGRILWANMHLLFWLSLVPFTTGWVGENHFASLPMMLYGIVLLLAAFAYLILLTAILAEHGPGSTLAIAVGKDVKGKISPAMYLLAIALAYPARWVALGLYVAVAMIWLIPDRRIESTLAG
jgi:uncharacterized membrane protein